ncbi:MAG: FAD-binding protein [Desulfobacteraceae bacterium]|nr:FAD-binding protein [Desulfobacteraceae bacterium]
MNTTKKTHKMSRRNFMTLAGGAIGFAGLTAAGFGPGNAFAGSTTANLPEINPDKLSAKTIETEVLVVGSGIAGVFAAVKAHDAGAKVLIVSKGRPGASGLTPFARGIFAYDPSTAKMSIDEYVASVSHSALGTNNPIFTRQMAKHSLERVKELKSWGFFDSNLFAESFEKPISERNIPVIERVMLTQLVKEKGKIAGAAGFSFEDGTVYFLKAKSVVLCTGAGGFKPSGFPVCELTHDGSIMAYRIGAKITGKEWNDGHIGNMDRPASVYDQWKREIERKPTVNKVDIRHDLGVGQNYLAYTKGPQHEKPSRPMAKDAITEGGPYRPSGFEKFAPPPSEGYGKKGDHTPPGMGGIPSGGASAGMSIHKSEGLVPYNEKGASNILGLYAAGDALGSHMSGGIYTQMGSSLVGSAVQGGISGAAAAAYIKGKTIAAISDVQQRQIRKKILAPLNRKRGYSPAWVTQTLQGIMIPNFVLYIKKESIMNAALAYVEELRDHHAPMLRAADLHELRLAHETANMIINAEMKLRSSIMRKESRCSHFRLDYPTMDTKNWNAWINIYKGSDGSMKLEKQPFNSWPA